MKINQFKAKHLKRVNIFLEKDLKKINHNLSFLKKIKLFFKKMFK